MAATNPTSTLSSRGAKLTAMGEGLEKLKKLFANTYDPETNPNGLVNMGVSENVCWPGIAFTTAANAHPS